MSERSGRRRRAAAAVRTSYHESSGNESTDEDDIIPSRNDEDASSDEDEEQDEEDSAADDGEAEDNAEDTTSVDAKGDNPKIAAKKRTRKSPFVYVTAADAAVDEEDNEDDGNKNEEDSGDDSDPPAPSKVCSHCNKQFSTPSRLRYHLEKRVCRKGVKPVSTSAAAVSSSAAAAVDESSTETAAADPPPAKKKKTRGKGKKGKPKKCRGKENERTCPRCKRVFTSLLGFQYHRDKKVCEKGTQQQEGNRPFYALTAGQQFTTKYGTVEVIRDEREVPTAPPIKDLPAKLKRYTSSKSKRDVQLKKRIVNARVDSIVRRRILSWNYKKHGGIVPKAIVDAYNFGEEGKRQEAIKPTEPSSAFLQDPTAPDNSYPDRLVECKWIPDQRPRQDGEASEPMEGQSTAVMSGTLYLQRRLLVTPYSADATRLLCSLCWQSFLSRPGYKHHFDSKSCQQRTNKVAAEKAAVERSVEIRARRKLEQRFKGQCQLLKDILCDSSDEGDDDNDGPKEEHCSSGINDETIVPVKAKSAKIEKVKEVRPQKTKSEVPILSPDAVLLALQSEYQLLQGRLLGPIYPQVWASLGFKKPQKKRVRKKKPAETSNKRIKRTHVLLSGINVASLQLESSDTKGASSYHDIKTAAAKRAAMLGTPELEMDQKLAAKNSEESLEDTNDSSRVIVPFPLFRASGGKISSSVFAPVHQPELTDVMPVKSDLPPMIDIQVFIGEVDSGRYPSMKRHQNKHDDECALCRKNILDSQVPATAKAAKLLPCTYCQKSVHFHCVGTRYRLKYPEPNEEFMCHHCISTVCQRRRRAEKRRLEKMDLDIPNEDEESMIRQKKVKLATELVPGQELECVSEQGKRCEDLSVLLADTRSRLDMYLKIAKGNEGRRKLISQMEKVQLE